MIKTIVVAAGFLLPMDMLAQNAQKRDTLETGFLQTVVISSHDNHTDFNGYRYDGQARTDRLLENIPGVNLISRGNFAQEPVLRGMSDGQINVTINGMRIYGGCTDRMDPATSYIEPNNMRSLQVCTGPGFGNCGAAIGGGLNFDLRQAQPDAPKKWSGSIGTGFETNAAARQFLGTIQYSSKRFAFSLDGIYRKAGDYTPGGNKDQNLAKYAAWTPENGFSLDDKGRINFSQYAKWNAHASASYQLNTHHSLNADYLRDQASDVGYPALTMDVRAAKSGTASITHEYHNTDKTLYDWQSKFYYSDINHAMDNSRRPMDELPMQMMMSMTGHSQTAGAYTQVYWKMPSAQLIKIKLETYVNRWHADMTMAMDSGSMAMDPAGMPGAMYRLTIPDAQRTDVGLDVSDEIQLGSLWHLTPGLHTEYAGSSIYSAPGKATVASNYIGNPDNPRLLYNAYAGLSYRPEPGFAVDLKLARAMRAPTLKELYANYLYNRVDGYDYVGNPGIKKESSFNTEINFSYRGKDVEAAIKGFGYFFQNYIAGFVQPGDSSMNPGAVGVKEFGNIRTAYIAGASLLASWHLSPQLLLNSNTTWQQGADHNGNDLPMMTPLKSINTLRYTRNSWRFFVEGISAAAQNKTSAFYGETHTPGFSIANIGADKSIDLHRSQLILGLSCNNIFNKYYTESLDVIKLPREGRNLVLHATYSL
jgi:iron complex outermembrane recepter protein